MKKNIFLFLLTIYITNCYSQENNTKTGPVIDQFGQVFVVDSPDLVLENSKKYKVIFDVYSDEKNKEELNASINTIARFLNMHAQNNTKPDNFDIVLILHGLATKNALTDEAYIHKYKMKNPNTDLIKDLKEANVKIYVCGQSFAHKGYKTQDLSKNILLSLSALTALVHYQSNGYQLITFN